jgi:uncharacterized membrane protein
LIPSARQTGIRFNNSGLNAGEMEAADSITLPLYTVALRVSHAVFTREMKKKNMTLLNILYYGIRSAIALHFKGSIASVTNLYKFVVH